MQPGISFFKNIPPVVAPVAKKPEPVAATPTPEPEKKVRKSRKGVPQGPHNVIKARLQNTIAAWIEQMGIYKPASPVVEYIEDGFTYVHHKWAEGWTDERVVAEITPWLKQHFNHDWKLTPKNVQNVRHQLFGKSTHPHTGYHQALRDRGIDLAKVSKENDKARRNARIEAQIEKLMAKLEA